MTQSLSSPRALARRLGLRALLCSLCALAALPLSGTAEAQSKTGKPKSRTEQTRTASSKKKSTSSPASTASKSKKSDGSKSSKAKKSEPRRAEGKKPAKSASTRSGSRSARAAAQGSRPGKAKKKQGAGERETRVAKKDSGPGDKGTKKEPRSASVKKKERSTGSRLAAAVRAGSARSRQRSRVLGEVLGTPRLEHLSRIGRLMVPVEGVRPERLRDSYTEARSEGRVHQAIDIHAPRGTPVVAVADGKVVKLHDGARGGLSIYHLDDDGQTRYYYAHLDRYAEGLREGQSIRQGEVIGYVGDTGNATPGDFHLHFSVALLRDTRRWWDGVNLNPYPLLARH